MRIYCVAKTSYIKASDKTFQGRTIAAFSSFENAWKFIGKEYHTAASEAESSYEKDTDEYFSSATTSEELVAKVEIKSDYCLPSLLVTYKDGSYDELTINGFDLDARIDLSH